MAGKEDIRMHELIKLAIPGDTEAFIKLIDENTLALYHKELKFE